MTTAALQNAFEVLVEEHKRILYKISHAYCRNPDDRDDLVQEMAVQLWRSFPSFDGRCRFSTWMYRVALNVAISFWRRERTRTRHVVASGENLLESAEAAGAENEDIRSLYRFIGDLDPLHRALALLYLDGNSYQEIAEVLGITESNVGTRIGRLKQRMKRELGKTDEASRTVQQTGSVS
jgi:RNA polymerase sigma-70 factor (ECF subfamily)